MNHEEEASKEQDKVVQGLFYPKSVVYCLKKFNHWPPTQERINRIYEEIRLQRENAAQPKATLRNAKGKS